jgi:hypothetical protein
MEDHEGDQLALNNNNNALKESHTRITGLNHLWVQFLLLDTDRERPAFRAGKGRKQ